MFVKRMLQVAHNRLITIRDDARVIEAGHFWPTSIAILSSSAIPMGCWPASSPRRMLSARSAIVAELAA